MNTDMKKRGSGTPTRGEAILRNQLGDMGKSLREMRRNRRLL